MDKALYQFISKQNNDPIIERKVCKKSGIEFPLYRSEQAFFDKKKISFAWHSFEVPTPELCTQERVKAKLIFRNERKLYRRSCDKTGKIIISNYAPDKNYIVYDKEYRRSDNRDALEYWVDFDYSKTFFEQFDTLLHKVPRTSSIIISAENSDYNNNVWYIKNCYLCFDNGRLEDCMYNARSYYGKNNIDMLGGGHNEQCYELIDCAHCNKCLYGQNLDGCYDCHRCYSCQNCSSCFLCTNLVNKQYCIRNKQYSKEDYQQEMQKIQQQNKQTIENEYNTIKNTSIHRATDNISCENVIGSHMKNCKSSTFLFGSQDSEDSRYCYDHIWAENNYEDIFGGNCKNCYEILGCETINHSMFCTSCRSWSSNLLYCDFCHASSNCFWCVWLRNKEYCIFNKQYTKETYEQEVAKIIKHMIQTKERGKFFPAQLSPFHYNESTVYEYFPLTREEAINQWYTRLEKEEPINIPQWMKTITTDQLPDIQQVQDDILTTAIICKKTGKPFRVVKNELAFYRAHNIQLPTLHPDERHYNRVHKKAGRVLYMRECSKTNEKIISMYPSDAIFPVYNEKSYDQEVYW